MGLQRAGSRKEIDVGATAAVFERCHVKCPAAVCHCAQTTRVKFGDCSTFRGTSIECGILFYIGGFLMKKIFQSIGQCGECKRALLGSRSRELADLTSLREYVLQGSNFHYLNNAVMFVLKSWEEHFNGITG
uniref:Uncharacterized protein n=1 Tax=Rhipicephalus zambeziensis TaxID=60191 RepID=A0A224Z1W6_9ACAR